jgi:hypothetical protein
MNAPKKIYYDPYVGTANREWVVGDTTYIREDVVLELYRLLDEALSYTSCESWSPSLTHEIKAALAKLEESHD